MTNEEAESRLAELDDIVRRQERSADTMSDAAFRMAEAATQMASAATQNREAAGTMSYAAQRIG
jgi:hypothetical protein